jgi:hypothetical protein
MKRYSIESVVAAILMIGITHTSLGEKVQWSGNGHWYEAIAEPGLTWQGAKAAAESRGGYLATITSADENNFVYNLIATNVPMSSGWGPWLGGYQPAGSSEPAGGWRWVTEEPWSYANWSPGQPDNATSFCGYPEDYLHYYYNSSKWNDFQNDPNPCVTVPGYVVEYDHLDDIPLSPANIKITPDAHYHLADLIVNGESVGVSNNYSFDHVRGYVMMMAVCEIDQHTLEVDSKHGLPTPAVGSHTYDYGTQVTCTMPVTNVVVDGTQYVCVGWTGTGSVPTSGTGNSVSFNLEKDSSIIWQWRSVSTLGVGLVAYYPFDGNASDASGNGRNGIVVGATFVPDRFNNPASAVAFTNLGEYVVVTNSLHPQGEVTLTYSCWFLLQSTSHFPASQNLICIGSFNPGERFVPNTRSALLFDISGPDEYDIKYCGEGNDYVVWPDSAASNVWHHIAVTKSNSHVAIYEDGNVLANGITQPGQNVTSHQLFMGWNGNPSHNAGEQFYGLLDDVRIYNRALSPDEVRQLCEQGSNQPVIDSVMPANGYSTTNATVQMQIVAHSTAGVSQVTVNGDAAQFGTNGWSYVASLNIGASNFTVRVTDGGGNSAMSVVEYVRYVASTSDLSAGLIAYYPFTTDFNDASGHSEANLTNGGGVIDPSGVVGSCVYFMPGAYADNSTVNISQLPCTISLWFKFKNLKIGYGQGSKILHNWGYGGNGYERGFTAGGSETPIYGMQGPTLTVYCALSGADTYTSVGEVASSKWEHIVVAYDAQGASVYRNGGLKGRYTKALASGNTPFWLGKDPGDWWGNLDGWIDEVRIYNRILSSNEVRQLYVQPSILCGPITNPANGHLYYLLNANTWTASEAEAIALGGHLATINDAAENQWIFRTFSSFSGTDRLLWIGFNDVAQSGTYIWSSGEPVTYTNWDGGQPSDIGIEHYVYMLSTNVPPDMFPRRAGAWNNYQNFDTEFSGTWPLYGVVEVVPHDLNTGLVAYYPFDGNANDASGNNNNGTEYGGATYTNSGFKGGAIRLDGNDDYVELNRFVIPTTGSFSVALWARQSSLQSGYREIISQGQSGGPGFYIGHTPNHTVRVGDAHLDTGIPFPSDGQWHQYAVTVDRSSNTTKFYIDSALLASWDALLISQSGSFTVFGRQFPSCCAEFFQGDLDEAYIYNRAISSNEVRQLYEQGSTLPVIDSITPTNGYSTTNATVQMHIVAHSAAEVAQVTVNGDAAQFLGTNGWSYLTSLSLGTNVFTVLAIDGASNVATSSVEYVRYAASTSDLSAGLVAYYPFNGNANDESGNGNDATVQSATLCADRFGAPNSAYRFTASSQYIECSRLQGMSANDNTVAAWIWKPSFSGTFYETIVATEAFRDQTIMGGDTHSGWTDGNRDVETFYSSSLNAGQWHHVVWVKNGTALSHYVDGRIQPMTRYNVNGVYSGSTGPIDAARAITKCRMGRDGVSSIGQDDPFTGKIDEVRLYNRALSPDEVRQLYEQESNLPVMDSITPASGYGTTNALVQMQIVARSREGMTNLTVNSDAAQLSGTNTWAYLASLDLGTNRFTVLAMDAAGHTATAVVRYVRYDALMTNIIIVPGSSDPWLAGQPDGTSASESSDLSKFDIAPDQSPVYAGSFIPGYELTWSATGCVSYCAGTCAGPNGDGTWRGHGVGAQNGISDIVAPMDSLLGIFLGPDVPSGAAPATLDFSMIGLQYGTLHPVINQVFFMGDGSAQSVVVPAGATRLFLGTMDGCEWRGNTGSFTVKLRQSLPSQSVPQNLRATAASATSISLAWNVLTDSVAVSGYFIYRDGAQVGMSAAPSYTDIGLTPDTIYTYAVSAFDIVSNESPQSASIRAMTTPTAARDTHCVSLNGGHIYPFTTWAIAATNIQAAIDVAEAGDTVLVTNGVYDIGGRVAGGQTQTNRLTIDKPMTLQSVNGPSATIIDGGSSGSLPPVRCAYVTNGALLTGFTLTHGDAGSDSSAVNIEATTGIPAYYSVDSLVSLRDALIARVVDFRDQTQQFLYQWDIAGEVWQVIAPYPLGQLDEGHERLIVGFEDRLYAYGKAPSDSVRGIYCSQDTGLTWQVIAPLDTPRVSVLLPRGPYLYIGTYADSSHGVYIYRLLLEGTNSLELVGRIPAQSSFGMERIDAMIGLRNDPYVLLFVTWNQGAGCGGGTPAYVFKATLDPNTGLMSGYRVVQSFSLIQNIRAALLEASDGTLFTGGGWCGPKPPYYSKDHGETWQPADVGVHPPNSAFSLAEYKGRVYIGTGYEPYHGQIYQWLGDSGPNYWELVQDIAPPRSIVRSLTVFNGRLFVGSIVYGYGGQGWETSTPVYMYSAVGHGDGGGVWCETGAVLSNCVITGNSADSGGGAYKGVLYNCLLAANSASAVGGGAYDSTLYNCTLVGNSAYRGGGVSDATLYNCIVFDNSSGDGASPNYASGTLRYCCTTPLSEGEGNISADPRFLNAAAGNYRLAANSPCINAGTNQDWMIGATDLDGNPRIYGGGRVDMGAYEYQGSLSAIPTNWLAQYGLPIDGSADQRDADGDGMSNWREWRSKTDPTNKASFLDFLQPLAISAPKGREIVVRWQSAEGVKYRLSRSTNLCTDGFSYLVRTNIPATPPINTETDTTAAGSGPWYYRVWVE